MAKQTAVDDFEGATLGPGALTLGGDQSIVVLFQSMITASSTLTALNEFVYEP